MAIGTSDGEQYENELDHAMGTPSISGIFSKAGPSIEDYTHDNPEYYDYEGFKASGIEPAENGHYPDTYKLPKHITFSDQSKYSGQDGNQGGQWSELSDGRWSFTPGPTNFEHHSIGEMREYFKKYERGNVLQIDMAKLTGNESQAENDYLMDKPFLDKTGVNLGVPGSLNKDFQDEETDLKRKDELPSEDVMPLKNRAYAMMTEAERKNLRPGGVRDLEIPGGGVAPSGKKSLTDTAKEFYNDLIGREPLPNTPLTTRGTITRQGLDRYNMELRRSPADNTLRTKDEMKNDWDSFTSPKSPETISSAAIRVDGKIYTGKHHGEAAIKAEKSLGKEIDSSVESDLSGFVTSKGRYVTREEANKIAIDNEQIPIGRLNINTGRLLSEDVKYK